MILFSFVVTHLSFVFLVFNLGELSVAPWPVVYTHLFVENTAGHSPLMVGPMSVHHCKEFRSYNYFLSTLVGLNHQAAVVKAVGTDGEKTLVDAVLQIFLKLHMFVALDLCSKCIYENNIFLKT